MVLSTLVALQFGGGATATGTGGAPAGAPIAPLAGPSCTVTVNAETAGNHAVQTAINAYGPSSSALSPVTICIGAGTFPEQLTINGSTDLSLIGAGNSSTFIAPSSAGSNGVDVRSGAPVAAVVGAWENVGLTIESLSIDGSAAASAYTSNCAPDFDGLYYGNTSGTASGLTVSGINTDSGCQGQLAVRVDAGPVPVTNTPLTGPYSVYVSNSTVSGYGKNGVSCRSATTSTLACTVTRNTVETSPMGVGFDATNGIEFFAVSGSILGNSVSGSYYLPGNCALGSYFVAPLNCNYFNYASGILDLESTSSVNISGNVLSGDQVGIWTLGNPAEIWDNHVSGGFFGIVTDDNSSDAFGPILSTGTDVAGGNTISGANVGLLAYDANASYSGNTVTGSNVSIEDENDAQSTFIVSVTNNQCGANVSGALLGNVSSFQAGAIGALPAAAFTVGGNTFTNISSPPGAATSFGALVEGQSAAITNSNFDGFSQGLATVVAGDSTVTGNVATAPLPTTGGIGIYVFADTVTVSTNTVSGWSWMNGPGWWPNSQSAAIFVQPEGTSAIDSNTVSDSAIGIAISSSVYGPFPAPSWPYAASPSAGPIEVSDNSVTDSGAFGIAFELNQHTSNEVTTPSVAVEGNTVDNTASGAVGMMFDQGTYTVTGNAFEGTTLAGSSGASQPTGVGTIDTASAQVLDAYDSATAVFAGSNTFSSTNFYFSLLNLTTGPPYFAAVIGDPSLGVPTTPTVSATALDVDQALTASGSIPTSGVPPYSWAWLVSINGGSYGAAGQCVTPSGSGAAGGTGVSCAVPGGSLSAGDTYNFELQVTDSATTPVTQTSAASATVTVSAALTTPAAPTVSATALDADQMLTVSATVPSTGSPPSTWTWLVSVNGGSYGTATQCTLDSGSGSGPVTCSIPGGTLTPTDTYVFEITVTDSATVPQTTTSGASATVTVESGLSVPATPTVTATALDANQALTVSGTIPTTGTSPYAWQWMVSVNGGAYVAATQCATNGGTGASAGSPVTCSVAAHTLTIGDTYAFELTVTDSASIAETHTSLPSPTVAVSSALSLPARPTVNRPALDLNQVLTVKGKIPSSGAAPYSWTWLVSVNGGSYGTATQCAAPTGTGASAGARVKCVIAGGTLTVGDYYNFELRVSDGATAAETKTSLPTLQVVTVSSTLTAPAAPSVSATALDVDQVLTVSGTIPSTGTSPYAWTWLVSVNGGSFATATQCTTNSGTGALAGSGVTCTVPANTLTVGDHYQFKLKVTDTATAHETRTSASSAKVTVKSAMLAPAVPSLSATRIVPAQQLTVTDHLPTTGTGPYDWTWLVSVNGGGYSPTTQCTANGGTLGAGGSTVKCVIVAGTLTAGDTYTFELTVTDSASAPESQTSLASHNVSVV